MILSHFYPAYHQLAKDDKVSYSIIFEPLKSKQLSYNWGLNSRCRCTLFIAKIKILKFKKEIEMAMERMSILSKQSLRFPLSWLELESGLIYWLIDSKIEEFPSQSYV